MKAFFDTIDYSKMAPGTSWGITIQKCWLCKRLGKVEESGVTIHRVKLHRANKKFNQIEQCEKDALD